VAGLTGYLLDDTPRKALQIQVRHAMKMESVGRLAGGIAHDFNNLLMIIIGLSEGLVEQMPPNDPLRADAVQILEAGRRGSSLASQVLAFSRKPHARTLRFDADEAIAATTPLIARLLGSRITLEVSCAPGPKWISADRTQLEQVLLNLATNAHDAMPEGGRLTLETMIAIQGPGLRHGNASLGRGAASGNGGSGGHSTPCVMIRMSDTGHGIPPETQARIFEPFFTTKVRGKGTGLGLAQVHSIVTEHGGIIEVQSGEGEGTTFTISLPLASPPDSDSA
jgi:signal transduction histidine kinase